MAPDGVDAEPEPGLGVEAAPWSAPEGELETSAGLWKVQPLRQALQLWPAPSDAGTE